MYSEIELGVDVVLELAEGEVDIESGAGGTTDVLSVDVVLEIPAMDDDGVEVAVLDVVSRLEEVVEYDLDVGSVAMGEDEVDDAVPEDTSRADDDQDEGILTVEKVDKVVPIEADCFPISVDVGRDRMDDDDPVFETMVEMPDAVSDVGSDDTIVALSDGARCGISSG